MKTKVCLLSELQEGVVRRVVVGSEPALVVRRGQEVVAVVDRCSHADAPLSSGKLDGFVVQCPLHGARFDLRTGAALSLPAVSPLDRFLVSVEGDDLYLEEE